MMQTQLAHCVCGRPPHRGMCAERWALRRAGDGVTARPSLKFDRPKRRFTEHTPPGNPYTLGVTHQAVVEGRTMFRARAIPSALSDRLLKGGDNNRKIGGSVTKGKLRGAAVFTLTLEERATCPRSCIHWRDCYGNVMNWPQRVQADDDLMLLLSAELRKLCARHDKVLVRLHVLGDFFSAAYVAFWHAMLHRLPGLHLYGYTARTGSVIADEITKMNKHPRCWVRFSGGTEGQFRAITVDTTDEAKVIGAIVCPVQTNRVGCCGECALCWSTPKAIAFLRH